MTTEQATRPLEWQPPRQAISRIPYLPGLDGMRALAVVAVMLYHADSAWLPGGFLGVEVFFVISGYLITLLLIGEHERTGTVSVRNFWLRRARRLLPALFLMMILVTIYTAVFRSDALGQLRGDVVAGLFYVSNWYQIWVGQGYTASGDFAPLRHLWSLAVEEQFYLLWPLAMIGLLRLGRRRLPDLSRWLFVASIGVTLVMALAYYPGPIGTCQTTPAAYWEVGGRCLSKTDTLYLGTFTRAGGLLIGAGFAMIWRPVAIMRGPIRRRGPVLDGVAVLGLGGLAALVWYVHIITPNGTADPWLFRGGFLLCGIATAAVIAAVTHRGAITGPLLGNPVLLWIGTRSYGLYLYHWPIYQIMREVAGVALTLTEFVIAMVLTTVVTELSYRFVETPIRRGTLSAWWRRLKAAHDPAPRRLIAGVGAACVAVSVFAGVNLATAELRPNEIAASLDRGDDAVTDVLGPETDEPSGSVPPSNTPPPTPEVTTEEDPTGASVVVPPPSSERGRSATTTTAEDPATTRANGPPRTSQPGGDPGPPIRALAIGDSVMLGAADEMGARGMTVDAVESRQMGNTVEAVERLRDQGRLGDAVVIHLGTNGYITPEAVDGLFTALADVPRVVALTIKVDREWAKPNNALLYDVPAQFSNVELIDWAGLGAACGDCFYDDGYHLDQSGQDYYTKLIVDTLAN